MDVDEFSFYLSGFLKIHIFRINHLLLPRK